MMICVGLWVHFFAFKNSEFHSRLKLVEFLAQNAVWKLFWKQLSIPYNGIGRYKGVLELALKAHLVSTPNAIWGQIRNHRS